jgi:hypothetical protein
MHLQSSLAIFVLRCLNAVSKHRQMQNGVCGKRSVAKRIHLTELNADENVLNEDTEQHIAHHLTD